MIDGLTYSAVLDLADVILKNNNKRDIKESTKIIDSLSLKKTKLVTISNQLNLFKISSVKIVEFVFMDKLTPKLEVEMEYIGKNKLVGKKSIMYLVDTKYQYNGIGYNYERDLECGDILKGSVILKLKGEDYPKKFPVENPNFSDYGGEFNVSVKSLVIDGKTVEIPDGNILEIETEIERNIEKLKGLKKEKQTLYKLKFTDK